MLGKQAYVVKSDQIDIELRTNQHCYASILSDTVFSDM